MQPAEYAHMAGVEERHWWFRARLSVVRAVLRRYVPPGGKGLDCSCGTGMTLRRLPGYVQMGADLSSLALGHCRHSGLRRLMLADLTHVPLSDAVLDLVTCLDTLEHIEDDVAALAEIHRVLRPGGHVLVTVPAHPFLFSAHDRALHHVRRYRRAELKQKILATGFKLRRFTYINSALFPLVALVRTLRPDRGDAASDTQGVPFALLNAALYLAFSAERLPLAVMNLPVGVSLLALAQREAQ
jgi:SAM-dependent methyltransferase